MQQKWGNLNFCAYIQRGLGVMGLVVVVFEDELLAHQGLS